MKPEPKTASTVTELDRHDLASRYANHVGHFMDRLDSSYADLTLKDHGDALLKAKVMILSVLAMRKGFNEPELGREARRFERVFDDPAGRRMDTGGDTTVSAARAVPIDWDNVEPTPAESDDPSDPD